MNTRAKIGLVALLTLAAAGCVPRQSLPPPGQPPVGGVPGPYTPGQTGVPAPPGTMAQASGPAVVALLGRGQELAAVGDYDHAAATVERALDVEPGNPFVYQRLAQLRIDQGEPGQADALAHKSNSLAGDNPYLKALNWDVIAQARRMRGDAAGAESAASQADFYRKQTQ